MRKTSWSLATAIVPTIVLAVVSPSGPGRSTAPVHAQVAADTGRPRYTKADVQFMQGMIGHHAQALAMTSLVPTRTKLESIRLLAQRIEVSQRDEIKLMRRWLLDRQETAPDPSAPHQHHDPAGHEALMPGMLTAEELAELGRTRATEFDRRFLELMIRHHEGALTMVAQLFGTQGAGQDADIFRFASDVDADQRSEIKRMRALLATLTPPKTP